MIGPNACSFIGASTICEDREGTNLTLCLRSPTLMHWQRMETCRLIAMTLLPMWSYLLSTSHISFLSLHYYTKTFVSTHIICVLTHYILSIYRTCLTPDLIKAGRLPVLSMRDRQIKAYLSVDVFGASATLRKRLLCSDLYTYLSSSKDNKGASKDGEYMLREEKDGMSYLIHLAHSRFCIAPRGTSGWTTRLFDIIYMGCVPVIISDYSLYPFQVLYNV